MKCVHPQHMHRNKGKPIPITKLKFNRKCSGINKKEPNVCRWLQREITPEQKIVEKINKRYS